MKLYDATEQAYNNGYKAGYDEGYKSGYNSAVAELETKKAVFCAKCRKGKLIYKWGQMSGENGEEAKV